MSLGTTGRALVAAATIALPLVASATAASAVSGSSPRAIDGREADQRSAFEAQQQSYVDALARAANEGAAGAPGARAGFAAQQDAYLAHLADSARVGGASVGGSSSFAGPDSGDGVPASVAVLLALGGMALGTGITVASRRLPMPARETESVAV